MVLARNLRKYQHRSISALKLDALLRDTSPLRDLEQECCERGSHI